MFSAERPAGYTGDWLALHPEAEFIMVRAALLRLGHRTRPAPRDRACRRDPLTAAPEQREHRPQAARGARRFPERLSPMWLNYQNDAAPPRPDQRLELVDFGGAGGSSVLAGHVRPRTGRGADPRDHAARDQRYWNVQLNDELWNAIEFVYRQSSLNGHQARLDADGRFRAVISLEDPGVQNWLDPVGTTRGMLIGRWYGAADTCRCRRCRGCRCRAAPPSAGGHPGRDAGAAR